MILLAVALHHAAAHHGFWWHFGHLYANITGATNESGPVYGSWSGIWGSLQPTLFPTILVASLTFYWHHTCHEPDNRWWMPLHSCWRWGHNTYTDDHGVTYRQCHYHHPHRPKKVTSAHIAVARQEHLARQAKNNAA